MGSNRREFLKLAGLAGLGVASTGVPAFAKANKNDKHEDLIAKIRHSGKQEFNMCGYAAPKIETVRIGFIGLGQRGPGAVERIRNIQGIEIKALCDIRPERVERTKNLLVGTSHRPDSYSGTAYAWKEMCERDDIDLIYICTPWDWHTPMTLYAMENDKHVACEVPIATTIEECWQIVETSERTRKHCMMLENCCYDFFELLTLNMAQKGYFGEIIHGEGAYIHDLLDLNFSKDYYYDMWRLKENSRHDGNLYPTHGLGPICQIMNINRGDTLEYLTSTSTADFMMASHAEELAEEDAFFTAYANRKYRGNMNTTTIKTKNGRTIMIQHDVTSPRPYSRIHLVSGTKAFARKWPGPAKIAKGHNWLSAEEFKKVEKEYTPEIVDHVGDMARQIGGHGGMDFIMDWRLIDCLRNGLPLDQDVYDAALWSSIVPLSEWSVMHRSDSIDIPDFTRGAWKDNHPVSLSLEGAGNTGILLKK